MSITLTPRAVAELKELIADQQMPSAALRVWVVPGGCSGLSYQMALDDQDPEEGDEVTEQDGVRIYIDALSLQYMRGASVDYVDDPMGGGFKIDNPNAIGSCGCGSSFRTEETDPYGYGGGCGGCGSR